MKRPRLVLAALLVGVCLPLGLATTSEAPLPDDFAPLVHRLMARDQIPGVAVGVVERGQLIFARGFGYRDVDSHLPVTTDTLFPLGSCSKAFTAVAVALLADEGRIGLDTPVRAYLPDFSLQDTVASATVTPRDLLTHRSGLPRHDFFWYEAPFSRDELYRRLRFLEPGGPPHARFRYNSLMFVVAARIVEKVSGQSWESFVEARILRPLNMRRTVLSPEAMEADSDHASPHAIRDGRVQRIPMLKGLNAIAPAGAVQSSVRDLARWLAFQATRSPGLLHEELWRELHRPQAEMPDAYMPVPDQPEVQHAYYALGWIQESYRGHTLVVHNGAIDGFTVHLGFVPETGQGLILLSNRERATAALTALAYSAYDRLLGLEPLDWEGRLEETPDPLQADRGVALDFPIEQVVGAYEHPAYGLLTIRADGDRLVMQFRSLRLTMAYQGERRFLSLNEIVDSAPQLSVQFSKPKVGEPLKVLVPLNFDDVSDPVEVFTRVTLIRP
jgi:CubicO group peptidase (beta-lactamase class C family)